MRACFFLNILVVVVSAFSASTSADESLDGQVAALMKARCARCHAPGTVSEQEPFLNTKDTLKDFLSNSSYVDPQHVNQSEVLVRVQNAEDPMPPDGKMLSADEVSLMERWIRNSAVRKEDRELVRDEQILRAVVQDVQQQPSASRRFLRYVTIHNLYNAGDSVDDLAIYRAAVSKLMNSLSHQAKIAVPAAVGPQQLILRLDLRDYGWTPHKWDAVAQHYPYALSGVDQKSEGLIRDFTHADPGVLRADWFVFVCSQAPLYHDLLELPDGDRAVAELEDKLGVDLAQNLADGEAIRAGFRISGVSRANRLIERHELGSHPGAYWISYDFSPLNAGPAQDLFVAPLGPTAAKLTNENQAVFRHDGGEIIFSLPNGMQAYLLATADGKRLNRAPIEIVQNSLRRDRVILNGISCMGCHSSGMKSPPGKSLDTVIDEVGPVTTDLAPDLQTRRLMKKLYPQSDVLQAAMKTDATRYVSAQTQAISPFVDEKTVEPVYKLYHRFLRPITIETFASELGEDDDILSLLERQTEDRALLIVVSMLKRGVGFPRKSFHDTFQQIAVELKHRPLPFAFLPIEEFGDEPGSQHFGERPTKSDVVRVLDRSDYQHSLSRSSAAIPGGGVVTAEVSDSTIRVGEALTVRISTTKDCHVRVLHFGADGSSTQMFPNGLQKDDLVRANKPLVILDEATGFQWITDGKTGPEHVVVVASSREFTDADQSKSFAADEVFRDVKAKRYVSRGQIKLRPVAKPTKAKAILTDPTATAELRLSYVLVP